MNLMHLRYFCKLAETQHYTLAANELYISQPGLSGAITSLEEELGVRLFEKKGRNVQLTKYGREFYEYVKKSLNVLDMGIAVAHEHSGKLQGSIDIGAITTILTDYLPAVIIDFQERYPKIQFNIFQGQTESIMPGLENATYDIGFCTYNKEHKDMTAIPIINQEVIAVVHKSHPLAEREEISLSELRDYDILSYSQSQQIGQQFAHLLQNPELQLDPDRIYFDYHNELYLAGILMQESFVSFKNRPVGLIVNVPHLKEFPDLRIIRIKEVSLDFHTVYMIYNNQTFNTHAVNLFIRFIRDNYSLLS